MSNESEGLSTPDLVGASDASDKWEDEPSESQNEASEATPEPDKTKAAKGNEAKPEPPKPALKKVKVGGREELVDEDELVRTYSKYKAGEDKFREAAALEKKLRAFTEAFEKDPLSVLTSGKLPIDRKSLGEKLLLEALEEEMLDPRERELRTAQAKLQEFETREQAAKREAEEREVEQRKEIKRQEITKLFTQALESTPLSRDPETAALAMRDMAMMLRAAKERGIEVSSEDLAKHVHSKYHKSMYSLANSLEGEDLIGFLGEDVVKKIRKADLARLKSNTQQMQTHKDDSWEVPASNRQQNKKMDAFTAKEHARKILYGK
jgi:hypothetical protein